MEAFAGHPLVLGHRGARREAPENTLPAFLRALEIAADGVELDVRLTRDGHTVVFHDATLERTTDGQGAVAKTTLADLRRLDAGSGFGPAFVGTRVCTLGEALDVLALAKLVNIELKGAAWPDAGLGKRVLEVIGKADMDRQVVLSSFDWRHLRQIRRLDRSVALAWLHETGSDGPVRFLLARALRLQALHPSYRVVSQRYLRQAQRYNLRVVPWTVNEEPAARRLAAWGIDGLITDLPGEMRRWLRQE